MKKLMKSMNSAKYVVLSGCTLVTLAGVTLCGPAQAQGDHPRYLHALSDLRTARAYLARPDERNVVEDERRAIRSVEDGIEQVKQAAIADGKDLGDRPRIDANLSHRDRLKRAIALLESARHDLVGDEDNRSARGWRARAIEAVDVALRSANKAARDDFRDDHPDHPYYLHALSDLRMARGLLYRREEMDVHIDQKNAIMELNEAIGKIIRASINDGKNIDDHPRIDVAISRRDRIRQAITLIEKAKSDILTREDNGRDIPWRNGAVTNLTNALEAARKASRDDRRDDRREDRRDGR